jgi:hypothetical protein
LRVIICTNVPLFTLESEHGRGAASCSRPPGMKKAIKK